MQPGDDNTPETKEPVQPASNWQFSADSGEPAATQQTQVSPPQSVSWTASEYIAHARGFGWFVLLGLGLFVVVTLIYFVTKDVLATVMVGIAGITFASFAARPPKVLNYTIDSQGVQIGHKHYGYAELRSFALLDDGPLPAVLLMPLKRFLPPITVFYEPKEEDAILDALSAYLPHENKEPDLVDKLMSRIRF